MSNEIHDVSSQWWGLLQQYGLLIAPSVLTEVWQRPVAPDEWVYSRLRDRYVSFLTSRSARGNPSGSRRTRDHSGLNDWLDAVLEWFLVYPRARWQKYPHVAQPFSCHGPTGESLRPDRVLLRRDSPDQAALLVVVEPAAEIAGGRARASYGRLLALLRGTGSKLGLLTNGEQFRLVYAGMDFDAWVQWDVATWFEEGPGRAQLQGLFALLGPQGMDPAGELDWPLLKAVEESRSRQGELAQVLGERVRRAVETLLDALDQHTRQRPDLLTPFALDPTSAGQVPQTEQLRALYLAATRIVMRLVVLLFAEARYLLPLDLEVYREGYSVTQLFTNLDRASRLEGHASLAEHQWAWLRLLASFRLIHEGGAGKDLPVPAYGGELFRRGDPASPDLVLRALAIFEMCEIDDSCVTTVLRLLKMAPVLVRSGATRRWVTGAVNFSDLRTEYIGIMYEGLLDYELRRSDPNEGPLVVLSIGQQPVVPLKSLTALSDGELRELLKRLGKDKGQQPVGTEEPEEEGEEKDEQQTGEVSPDEPEAEEPEPTVEMQVGEPGPRVRAGAEADAEQAATEWALRAVRVARLVRGRRSSRTRSGRPPGLAADERESEAATRLIKQVVDAGRLYLVRWGGTRKSSGTFYTPPQLAVPTVQRALEPLVFLRSEDGTMKPRPPEDILALKVVDFAMGSGAFLVAALRYLTDAVYASLIAHNRLPPRGPVTLPFGLPARGLKTDLVLPLAREDPQFEVRCKALLKHEVVKRCLYGVDINPMAVELGRLALWVETMDRQLPFEFLDHKLKVGNSLIGCWFDRYQDYPLRAWDREGGDGKKGARTASIKRFRDEAVRRQLVSWLLRQGDQQVLKLTAEDHAADVQMANRRVFERLQELTPSDREALFREKVVGSRELAAIRQAFDRWCALWVWPVSSAEEAPSPSPFQFFTPTPEQEAVVRQLTARHRFFHWEIEFPDVFTPDRSGFDAVVGNPPGTH